MHDRSRLRHTISLQTAWEPAAAGLDGWTRRFGRPLELPAGESLVLVIVPASAAGPPRVDPARATLNGIPLAEWPAAAALAEGTAGPDADAPAATRGGARAFARDVTGAVAARNELVLFVDDLAGERSLDGPARHRPLPTGVARVWLEVQAAPPGPTAGAADHP